MPPETFLVLHSILVALCLPFNLSYPSQPFTTPLLPVTVPPQTPSLCTAALFELCSGLWSSLVPSETRPWVDLCLRELLLSPLPSRGLHVVPGLPTTSVLCSDALQTSSLCPSAFFGVFGPIKTPQSCCSLIRLVHLHSVPGPLRTSVLCSVPFWAHRIPKTSLVSLAPSGSLWSLWRFLLFHQNLVESHLCAREQSVFHLRVCFYLVSGTPEMSLSSSDLLLSFSEKAIAFIWFLSTHLLWCFFLCFAISFCSSYLGVN